MRRSRSHGAKKKFRRSVKEHRDHLLQLRLTAVNMEQARIAATIGREILSGKAPRQVQFQNFTALDGKRKRGRQLFKCSPGPLAYHTDATCVSNNSQPLTRYPSTPSFVWKIGQPSKRQISKPYHEAVSLLSFSPLGADARSASFGIGEKQKRAAKDTDNVPFLPSYSSMGPQCRGRYKSSGSVPMCKASRFPPRHIKSKSPSPVTYKPKLISCTPKYTIPKDEGQEAAKNLASSAYGVGPAGYRLRSSCGVQVESSRISSPLFTYSKTDTGRSPLGLGKGKKKKGKKRRPYGVRIEL